MNDLCRWMAGIHVGHDVFSSVGSLGVVVEDGLRLRFVDADALLDDFLLGIIEAIVLERALPQTAGQFGAVWAAEMKDLQHFDVLLHELSLLHVARDAVQNQEIDVRLELVSAYAVMDAGAPQLDGDLIRHQLAAARIGHKLLPQLCAGVERAEDVAASHVMKARDSPHDQPLRALAAARRAEDEEGAVFLWDGGGIRHKAEM